MSEVPPPIDITPYVEQTIERYKEVVCSCKWSGSFVDGNGDISFHRDGRVVINGVDHTWSVRIEQEHLQVVVRDVVSAVQGAGLVRVIFRIDERQKRLFGLDWKQPSFTSQIKSPEFYKIEPFVKYQRYARTLACDELGITESVSPAVFYTKPVRKQQVDTSYQFADEVSKDALRAIDKGLNKNLPAIVLIGCDRPQYFEQTLKSLAATPQFSQWPVIAFLDNPPEPGDKEYQTKQVGLLKKVRPDAAVVTRSTNWGCGRNIVDARRQVFSKLGFGRMYLFEDDMEVSPHYITVCENIWNWAESCGYYDIGAVQAWNFCTYPSSVHEKYASYIKDTSMFWWWGYSMSHLAWKAIEPQMLKYAEDFFNCRYADRDHKAGVKYLQDTAAKPPKSLRDFDDQPEYPSAPDCAANWRKFIDTPPSGQDAATATFFHQAGFRRLTTVLSRARMFGRVGIHADPEFYERAGFGKVPMYSSDSDARRTEFIEELELENFRQESEIKGLAISST